MDVDFWLAVENSLMDSEVDELQRRRDERMSRCMKDVQVTELHDGRHKMIYWRCKDPRCEYCNSIRGLQMRNRIASALISGFDIAVSWVNRKQADKKCKRVGKYNYVRIPQDEDLDIVFRIVDPKEMDSLDTQVDWPFVNSFDWKECCRRKTSRIISGSLCKESENESGQYEFKGKDLVAGPKEVVEEAYKKTCLEVVPWQQPETIDENQRVRDYFNGQFISKIIAYGGNVHLILDKKIKSETLQLNFIQLETDFTDSIPLINPP